MTGERISVVRSRVQYLARVILQVVSREQCVKSEHGIFSDAENLLGLPLLLLFAVEKIQNLVHVVAEKAAILPDAESVFVLEGHGRTYFARHEKGDARGPVKKLALAIVDVVTTNLCFSRRGAADKDAHAVEKVLVGKGARRHLHGVYDSDIPDCRKFVFIAVDLAEVHPLRKAAIERHRELTT